MRTTEVLSSSWQKQYTISRGRDPSVEYCEIPERSSVDASFCIITCGDGRALFADAAAHTPKVSLSAGNYNNLISLQCYIFWNHVCSLVSVLSEMKRCLLTSPKKNHKIKRKVKLVFCLMYLKMLETSLEHF